MSAGFGAFWQAYPVKVGKLAAIRAWQRRHPDLSQVLEALAWQTQSDQWRKGYIPHPTTYLNQGRWLDERPQVDRLDGRQTEAPCAICGYPEPRYHSRVECNRRYLEQQPASRSQE